MFALGKHASDRIINLKLYCTVNENVLIFFLIGNNKKKTNKQMARQKVK